MSIGGNNLQFYTNFALLSTLGGMNLDHDFFQVRKLSEDQKKNRSSPKMEHFFPQIQVKTTKKGLHRKWNFFPRIQVETCGSDAQQSKSIGGDADEDYTQIIGGE